MDGLPVGTVATQGGWNAFAKRQQLAKAGLRAVLVLLKQLLPVTSQHVECWANLGIEGWIEAPIAAVSKGEYQGACGFLCLCPCQALVVVVRHKRPAMELSWPLMGRYWMGTHDWAPPWLIRCGVPMIAQAAQRASSAAPWREKSSVLGILKSIFRHTDGLGNPTSRRSGVKRIQCYDL